LEGVANKIGVANHFIALIEMSQDHKALAQGLPGASYAQIELLS
jgi:hypothetical protein